MATKKKRNPTDATMRNINALKKRVSALAARVLGLEVALRLAQIVVAPPPPSCPPS